MKFAHSRRRALAVSAALAALALGLTACTGSGQAASGEVPDVKGNPAVELSVFAAQFPDANLKTNAFSKLMTEKYNITFDWQTTTLDGGAAKEKRQITLASGDYPDAFLLIPWVDQFTPADILKYGKQGVLVPLQGLIKKYAPNIQKALDENEEFRKMATTPDGNIYGLPQWNDCFHCSYPSKYWINTDWLNKLGLQQPTTTEELRDVLTAFKTQDPNGNGKADEIPLSGNTRDSVIPYLMNAFVYDPQGQNQNSTVVLDDGKVAVQATTDGWREGLEYITSLYSDGLIDPAAFTQNPDAEVAQGNFADAVILGSGTTLHPANFLTLGQADGRDKQYDPVAPLTGPDGASFASYQAPYSPGATFALTNKASGEEKVQAIKMIDYLFTTEGGILGTFGTEGVNWNVPGADAEALDPALKPLYETIPLLQGEEPTNSFWSSTAQYWAPADFRNAQAVITDIYDPAGFERRLYDATLLYDGKEDKDAVFPYWTLWVDPSLATEVSTLQTNIENYVQQSSLEFITGQKDVSDDGDWKSYVDGLDGLGIDRYLEIQQKAYDQVYK